MAEAPKKTSEEGDSRLTTGELVLSDIVDWRGFAVQVECWRLESVVCENWVVRRKCGM